MCCFKVCCALYGQQGFTYTPFTHAHFKCFLWFQWVHLNRSNQMCNSNDKNPQHPSYEPKQICASFVLVCAAKKIVCAYFLIEI